MKEDVNVSTVLKVYLGLVAISAVFLILKLIGIINWSWFWVSFPVSIPFLLTVVGIALWLVLLIVGLLWEGVATLFNRWN